MTEQRHCATCANWMPGPTSVAGAGPALGECHRYAPRPLLLVGHGPAEGLVLWPATRANDGCGEWYYGGDRLGPAVVLTTARAADATAAGSEGADDEAVLPAS